MKKALSIFLAAILMFSFASLAFADYAGSPADSPVDSPADSPSDSPIGFDSIISITANLNAGGTREYTKEEIEEYFAIFTEDDYNSSEEDKYFVNGAALDSAEAKVVDDAFAAALANATTERNLLGKNVTKQIFYVYTPDKQFAKNFEIVFNYKYQEGFAVSECVSAWDHEDEELNITGTDEGYTVLTIADSAVVGIFNFDESADTYELSTAVYAIGAVVLAAAAVVVFMVAKKKKTIAE